MNEREKFEGLKGQTWEELRQEWVELMSSDPVGGPESCHICGFGEDRTGSGCGHWTDEDWDAELETFKWTGEGWACPQCFDDFYGFPA